MEKPVLFLKSELSAESFKELLPDFFLEVREDFSFIKTAATTKSIVEVRKKAHKIKGSAASYSAVFIAEKARILQESVDQEKYTDLNKLILELEKAIELSYQYAKEVFL